MVLSGVMSWSGKKLKSSVMAFCMDTGTEKCGGKLTQNKPKHRNQIINKTKTKLKTH